MPLRFWSTNFLSEIFNHVSSNVITSFAHFSGSKIVPPCTSQTSITDGILKFANLFYQKAHKRDILLLIMPQIQFTKNTCSRLLTTVLHQIKGSNLSNWTIKKHCIIQSVLPKISHSLCRTVGSLSTLTSSIMSYGPFLDSKRLKAWGIIRNHLFKKSDMLLEQLLKYFFI